MIARIARFSAVVAFLILAVGAIAGVAGTQSVEDAAFARAKKIAHVSAKESKNWPVPIVTVYNDARYLPYESATPADPQGGRICGLFNIYLTGSPTAYQWLVEITMFVRPDETKLLGEGLTHEYLHLIWFERSMDDPKFYAMNPSSEDYVRALFPAECPQQ